MHTIEYLLIKKKDDFCATTDQFRNMINSNTRLDIKENTITLCEELFDYDLTSYEVSEQQKEIVFHFTVRTQKESNIEALEQFDYLLHRIIKEYGNHFLVNTIWDDVSIHYGVQLYPRIVIIENLLRKIIYEFMIKTVGSDWFERTVPDDVKKAVDYVYKKNETEKPVEKDQLQYADFIQLGAFFFVTYRTQSLSDNLIKKLKKEIKRHQWSDDDDLEKRLVEILNSYEAKSNWDRYFSDKIDIADMPDKWEKLYLYRNAIAHSRRLRQEQYEEADNLIEELEKAFEKCLDDLDEVELNEEEMEAVQEVAKDTIGASVRLNTGTFYGDNYPGLTSGISSFGVATSKIMPKVDYSGLNSAFVRAAGINSGLNGAYESINRYFLKHSEIASALEGINETTSEFLKSTGAFDSLRKTSELLGSQMYFNKPGGIVTQSKPKEVKSIIAEPVIEDIEQNNSDNTD